MIDRELLKINLELKTIDILKKYKVISKKEYNKRWLKAFQELGELITRPSAEF